MQTGNFNGFYRYRHINMLNKISSVVPCIGNVVFLTPAINKELFAFEFADQQETKESKP